MTNYIPTWQSRDSRSNQACHQNLCCRQPEQNTEALQAPSSSAYYGLNERHEGQAPNNYASNNQFNPRPKPLFPSVVPHYTTLGYASGASTENCTPVQEGPIVTQYAVCKVPPPQKPPVSAPPSLIDLIKRAPSSSSHQLQEVPSKQGYPPYAPASRTQEMPYQTNYQQRDGPRRPAAFTAQADQDAVTQKRVSPFPDSLPPPPTRQQYVPPINAPQQRPNWPLNQHDVPHGFVSREVSSEVLYQKPTSRPPYPQQLPRRMVFTPPEAPERKDVQLQEDSYKPYCQQSDEQQNMLQEEYGRKVMPAQPVERILRKPVATKSYFHSYEAPSRVPNITRECCCDHCQSSIAGVKQSYFHSERNLPYSTAETQPVCYPNQENRQNLPVANELYCGRTSTTTHDHRRTPPGLFQPIRRSNPANAVSGHHRGTQRTSGVHFTNESEDLRSSAESEESSSSSPGEPNCSDPPTRFQCTVQRPIRSTGRGHCNRSRSVGSKIVRSLPPRKPAAVRYHASHERALPKYSSSRRYDEASTNRFSATSLRVRKSISGSVQQVGVVVHIHRDFGRILAPLNLNRPNLHIFFKKSTRLYAEEEQPKLAETLGFIEEDLTQLFKVGQFVQFSVETEFSDDDVSGDGHAILVCAAVSLEEGSSQQKAKLSPMKILQKGSREKAYVAYTGIHERVYLSPHLLINEGIMDAFYEGKNRVSSIELEWDSYVGVGRTIESLVISTPAWLRVELQQLGYDSIELMALTVQKCGKTYEGFASVLKHAGNGMVLSPLDKCVKDTCGDIFFPYEMGGLNANEPQADRMPIGTKCLFRACPELPNRAFKYVAFSVNFIVNDHGAIAPVHPATNNTNSAHKAGGSAEPTSNAGAASVHHNIDTILQPERLHLERRTKATVCVSSLSKETYEMLSGVDFSVSFEHPQDTREANLMDASLIDFSFDSKPSATVLQPIRSALTAEPCKSNYSCQQSVALSQGTCGAELDLSCFDPSSSTITLKKSTNSPADETDCAISLLKKSLKTTVEPVVSGAVTTAASSNNMSRNLVESSFPEQNSDTITFGSSTAVVSSKTTSSIQKSIPAASELTEVEDKEKLLRNRQITIIRPDEDLEAGTSFMTQLAKLSLSGKAGTYDVEEEGKNDEDDVNSDSDSSSEIILPVTRVPRCDNEGWWFTSSELRELMAKKNLAAGKSGSQDSISSGVGTTAAAFNKESSDRNMTEVLATDKVFSKFFGNLMGQHER